MIQAIREYLNANAGRLVPGGSKVRGVILAGGNKAPSSKVVLMFFDRRGEPVIVAKVARTEEGEWSLRREFEVLRALWSSHSGAVTGQAPEPLELVPLGGRLVLLVSAMPGEPMFTRYHTPGHTSDPDVVAGDFRAASSWLLRFHRETRTASRPLDAETFDTWVGSVFDRYAVEIGWSPEEGRLLSTLRERAAALDDVVLPLTGAHGDYWMGNLLVEDGKISGVIDWECGHPCKPPLSDVYKFATSYGFYLDRTYHAGDAPVPGHPDRSEHLERWRKFGSWPNLVGFGYTYFGRGWFPEQVRRFVLEHLSALGITPDVNAVFFPVFLAEQAMTLDVPEFRDGYRSLLAAFFEERESSWLWKDAPDPSMTPFRIESNGDGRRVPAGLDSSRAGGR